jgi:high-affinity K+ transport system ATPase subunit B
MKDAPDALSFSLGFDSPAKVDSFTSSELVRLEAILAEVDQKAAKNREVKEGISSLKAIKEEEMVGERTYDVIVDEGGDASSVKGHGQRQKKNLANMTNHHTSTTWKTYSPQLKKVP